MDIHHFIYSAYLSVHFAAGGAFVVVVDIVSLKTNRSPGHIFCFAIVNVDSLQWIVALNCATVKATAIKAN